MRRIIVLLVMTLALTSTYAAVRSFRSFRFSRDHSIYVVDAQLLPYRLGLGLGRWRPADDQALIVRDELRKYLSVNRVRQPRDVFNEAANRAYIFDAFDSYALQMQGVRAAKNQHEFYDTEGFGPKQIHINAVCASARGSMTNMSSEQMEVSDGGNCYFTALYDLNTTSIILFMPGGN